MRRSSLLTAVCVTGCLAGAAAVAAVRDSDPGSVPVVHAEDHPRRAPAVTGAERDDIEGQTGDGTVAPRPRLYPPIRRW